MELDLDQKPQALKMQDLVDFFSSTGVSSKCTACNTGTFGINILPSTEADEKIVRLWVAESAEIIADGTLKSTGHLYPTIYTICNNCGYVRHFSPTRVLAWLKEKRAIEGKGQ